MCGSLGKNTNQALLPTGASVADVVGTWTRQMGYPFIRVNTEGKTLKVKQGKFTNPPLPRIYLQNPSPDTHFLNLSQSLSKLISARF